MSPIEPQVRGSGPLLIRHEGHTPRERSACGWRDRLISREDAPQSPAAWAHAVDIDGAKLHYHKRSTELYYVLDGSGSVILDGAELPVAKGSLVHIVQQTPTTTTWTAVWPSRLDGRRVRPFAAGSR